MSAVGDFVVVTPAHDEAAHLPRTIEAMCAQTVRPLRWVIVDDGSSDDSAAVVRAHAAGEGFIRLVRRLRPAGRHFGNKVLAFRMGLAETADLHCRFIANLDADVALPPDYFARVLAAFEADPRLGLAGGMVHSRINGRFVSQAVAPDSVAGAVQMFRRACFEQIGGYLALPHGGIDAAAEIMARMRGWHVRTLQDLAAFEHRRTGTARASALRAKFREGRRLHGLGYEASFMVARAAYRALTPPPLLGSAAMLLGFAQAAWRGEPRVLPPEVVSWLRREQRRKLVESLKGLRHVRHLRHP